MATEPVKAIYRDTGVMAYSGNPFIEALPPLQESIQEAKSLKSNLKFRPEDLHQSNIIRAHNICRIIDDYFQPLSLHLSLTERVSIMIRGGYVGRNPKTGDLQKHLQNGYERIQQGDLTSFRFED